MNIWKVASSNATNVSQNKVLVGVICAVEAMLDRLDVIGKNDIDPRLLKGSSD
jgi:hypothetical protein